MIGTASWNPTPREMAALKINQRVSKKDVDFLTLKIPAETPIPMSPDDFHNYGLTLPIKPGDKGDTCFAALITMVLEEIATYYPHNRGEGGYSEKTTKSCREGINFDVIGEVTLGAYSDKTHYGDDKKRLCFNGFHSRLLGAFQRHIAGEMTQEEYLKPISIRYSNDFLGAYQDQGRGGSQHRTKDRIWTADLVFGDPLRKIKLAVGTGIMDKLGGTRGNKSTVFSAILIALAQEKSGESVEWKWHKIYKKRGLAAAMSEERAGHLKIAPVQLAKVIEGIKLWYDMIVTLERMGSSSVKAVDKIVSSAGLFGDFVICHYGDSNIWPKNHELTAERILNELVKVSYIVKNLCRGDSNEILEAEMMLHEIINKRVVKKRK